MPKSAKLKSLKISIRFGNQDKNFLLDGEEVCNNINGVKQFCFYRFPLLVHDKNLRMFWIDQHNDEICLITDSDYSAFVRAADNTIGHLFVEGKAPDNEDLPQHTTVSCDVCDQMVVGHRYKCLICPDYDLCMTCEAQYRHKDHVMLRIPRPIDMLKKYLPQLTDGIPWQRK
ncbi:protein ref(2)P-like [Anopheles coustani]|uniref:protein ref(2)P-like n=1 Tax=Anopheles coustani TaxID=139045 RepID=UPI0026599FF7|nr:protein ref(2)P-like [Anopheles coustani]